MMGNKKNTKSAVILREAKVRVTNAEQAKSLAWDAFKTAEAVAFALSDSYYALEKSLARAVPKSPPSTTAPPAKVRSPRKSRVVALAVDSATGMATITDIGVSDSDDEEGVAHV